MTNDPRVPAKPVCQRPGQEQRGPGASDRRCDHRHYQRCVGGGFSTRSGFEQLNTDVGRCINEHGNHQWGDTTRLPSYPRHRRRRRTPGCWARRGAKQWACGGSLARGVGSATRAVHLQWAGRFAGNAARARGDPRQSPGGYRAPHCPLRCPGEVFPACGGTAHGARPLRRVGSRIEALRQNGRLCRVRGRQSGEEPGGCRRRRKASSVGAQLLGAKPL